MALIPKGNMRKRAYRPICILNTFSKIYEHIIANRLQGKINVSESQYGFRKGRSTINGIKIRELYEKNTRLGIKRRLMVAVGLHEKNAFNSLKYTDAIISLRDQGVECYLIELMKDNLSERFLVCGDLRMPVYSGCPRGGILSPLLWNIV